MSFILLGILNSQVEAAGGAGSYDLLETTLISTNTASVTFSNLGSYSNYKHLQIRATVRNDQSANSLRLQFNSDTGSNYSRHYIQGNGSTVPAFGASSQSFIECGFMANSGNTTNAFGANIVDILDFSNTNKNTTVRAIGGNAQQAGFNTVVRLNSGAWYNTNAVTSMLIYPSADFFISGSRFSLYGVK